MNITIITNEYSKGSGGGETKNGFRPGLTREEHMALWEKEQA